MVRLGLLDGDVPGSTPRWEKQRQNKGGWEWLRYFHFALSGWLVTGLFFIGGYRYESGSEREFWWLLIGNAIYYGTAIILAWVLRENRALCKYLCPGLHC